MSLQELQISQRQLDALLLIARENHTDPEELVRLAVDALIAEVNRNHEWLVEARANFSTV